MTPAQESGLSESRARTRQDRKVPFLIHVDDARLIPNTPLTAKIPKYRPFLGDYRASEAERRAFLRSGGYGAPTRRQVVQSAADDAPFDLGKASKDDLVAFAFDQYQTVLDPAMSPAAMRKRIAELAAADSEKLG